MNWTAPHMFDRGSGKLDTEHTVETPLDPRQDDVCEGIAGHQTHAQSPMQTKRIRDLVAPQSGTDALVAMIADQLCGIVDDQYDIRIRLDEADAESSLQVQKLVVLINSLLENVRRNIGSLSVLAEELESKVRERTRKLDLIVKGSNDGVWIWDLENDLVEYSPRWRQLVGLDAEPLGTIEDWLRRVHPEDQERLRAGLRAHLQGTRKYLREDYRIQHADGTYRWMWCRGRCHRDEDGRPTLMAGTQTDVHQMRSVDALTELPNEQTLMADLDAIISRGRSFRAMVIGVPRVVTMKEDLDSDELSSLRAAIARRLSATLPFGASLSQLSGDFFAVVAPDSVLRGTFEDCVLTPILEAFERPFETRRRAIWLDAAVGATMPVSAVSVTASDVMRDAWTSYRCARRAGRKSNVLSKDQVEAARDRAFMQQEVRLGLERGWFIPYFQPIVDMNTREILGFETLCRMSHPDLGVISPGRFIPVADDLGVTALISERMLDEALDQLGTWATMKPPFCDLFLTVNLEADQIMRADFPDMLREALARRHIPPRNLKIEIVENSVVSNFAVAAKQITRLREVGVKIALDDFGTGYSSLEYLNELSFDLIKVDKGFVDNVEQDPRKRSMVRMICVLGNALGADICVEGIETEAQAKIMGDLRVAFGQGYLFAKPLPRDAIATLLEG